MARPIVAVGLRATALVLVAGLLPVASLSLMASVLLVLALCLVGFGGLRRTTSHLAQLIQIAILASATSVLSMSFVNALTILRTHAVFRFDADIRAPQGPREEGESSNPATGNQDNSPKLDPDQKRWERHVIEVRSALGSQLTTVFEAIATEVDQTRPEPDQNLEGGTGNDSAPGNGQEATTEETPADTSASRNEAIAAERKKVLTDVVAKAVEPIHGGVLLEALMGTDPLDESRGSMSLPILDPGTYLYRVPHSQKTFLVTDHLIDRAVVEAFAELIRAGAEAEATPQQKAIREALTTTTAMERLAAARTEGVRAHASQFFGELGGPKLLAIYQKQRDRNGPSRLGLSSAIEDLKNLANARSTILIYPAPRFVMLCNGAIQWLTVIAFWAGVFFILRAIGLLPYDSIRLVAQYERWDGDGDRARVLSASWTDLDTLRRDGPRGGRGTTDGVDPIHTGHLGSGALVLAPKEARTLGSDDTVDGLSLLWALSAPVRIDRDGGEGLTAGQVLSRVEDKLTAPYERRGSNPPLVLEMVNRVLITWGTSGQYGDVAHSLNTATDDARERNDNELEFCRYIVWLLPSIGFVGTIVGIGNALMRSERMVNAPPELQGEEVSSVTDALGLAFDTTLVALALSVVIVLMLHAVQFYSSNQVEAIKRFVKRSLIDRMRPA